VAVLEFLAQLSYHLSKTYESITRYNGRYSSRRRGERAKLSPPPDDEPESDYRRDFGERSTELTPRSQSSRVS
jgi:hypothetical protein